MKNLTGEEGFVMIVALIIMTVLTIIGIAANTNTSLELKIAGNERLHKKTFYEAEAGAVLSTEVLEQNLNCPIGFTKNVSTDADNVTFADLEGNIRVYSRSNGLAIYRNDLPWTTSVCNITTPTSYDISYPVSSISSGIERTDVYLGGYSKRLPGGALQMAAGYERKGKSAADGGTARFYDIISKQSGLNGSESIVIFGWRHLVGSESTCNY